MNKNEIKELDFYPELNFNTSRSGGKGGQHVNKTETRVELRFDIDGSQLLNEKQKSLLKKRLKSYITDENVIQLFVQDSRSQYRNKEMAVQRFYELMIKGLTPQKKRKKTKAPASAERKRLQEKQEQAEKKKRRQDPPVPPGY